MRTKKLAAAAALMLTVSAGLAGSAGAHPRTNDADRDHMADSWELAHGLNPSFRGDGKLDADGDGLRNDKEFRLGSDPQREDTDNDGIDDGDERPDHAHLTERDANHNGVVD